MPKQGRERTTYRSKDPLSSNITDLKDKVCTMTSGLIMSGGRINIILDYLVKVQEDMNANGDIIPSIGELKGDLMRGFRELNKFKGELIGTPSLNQEEEKKIYLTSEEAKKIQLKKDDWLKRFTDSDNKNIIEWLKDDSVNKMFELSDDVPVTPRILTEEMGDQWEDISVIYNNTIDYLRSKEKEAGVTELLIKMPSNLPLTHISINRGKIRDYELFIKEIGDTLLNRSVDLAKNIVTIFTRLGLTTLKIGGYTMAIATKFISDLFVNILRNKIHSGLWSMIEQGVGYFIDAPFIITDNKIEIQGKINYKYRLFLCLIIIKTIFMLGNLIFKAKKDTVDTPHKLRELLTNGIKLLNSYNTVDKNYYSLEFVSEEYRDIREHIDYIMIDMNKLTEWYLMRKTIVFDMNKSEEKLLILDKKEFRNMNASEIDDILSREADMDIAEPEPGDETGSAAPQILSHAPPIGESKKKRSKRKRKSSKKKKGKKRKQTKRRKKK